MLIVDAQLHVWGADTPERPWPAYGRGNAHRPVPFSKEDALREMDAAGVNRAVLVPPSWEGDRNDLALEAARLHPDRFAVMGRFTVDRATQPALARWREQPGMLGLRFVYRPEMTWLYDDSAEWLWQACEEHALPVMMFAPNHLPAIDRLAERHPRLKLVLDHMEMPHAKDAEATAHLPQLLAIARHANVAAKASSVPSHTSEPYPHRNMHDFLRQVFTAFGPRRFFWGTDLTGQPGTYRQALTMFTEELSFLSSADKEWVMGRGVCEWLRWPIDKAGSKA
ncbi:MAG: amidohydrolase family protein [Acetobacteraceae bacterium]